MLKSLCLRVTALIFLPLVGAGCATHHASDPAYGTMFKQTTQDRVQGDEFWGSNRQKDCVAGGGMGYALLQGKAAFKCFYLLSLQGRG
jgi:hypothetical protein